MANPLDTDIGSELFGSYEAEFKLVEADVLQKLEQIPELQGESRKSAITQAERALDEAQELLGQMRLEKQNIPANGKTKVNQRIRAYENEVDKHTRRLRTLKSDARAQLLGGNGRYTDHPDDVGGDNGDDHRLSDLQYQQRQQLLAGTERLDRSSQRLRASQALASETEAIGASTLADLERQREVIRHTHDSLLESEGYVDRSIKTIRTMTRSCLMKLDYLISCSGARDAIQCYVSL